MLNPIKLQKHRNLFVAILVLLTASILLTSCSSKEVGTVKEFGQAVPSGGGMVQSYAVVELDDGTEVTAWLPIDQEIWDTVQAGARSGNMRIEIQKEGEYWEFVQIVPSE